VLQSGGKALDGEHPCQKTRDQNAGDAPRAGCKPCHAAKGTRHMGQVKEDDGEPKRIFASVAEPAQKGLGVSARQSRR